MGFVVDASVCPKWFFDEEHKVPALRLLREGVPRLAPDLLLSEVGNVIWKKCARGEIAAAEGDSAMRAFHQVDIDIRSSVEFSLEALKIANELRHPFYDCLYLALAIRENLQLVTADRRLCTKVVGTPYERLTLWIEDVPS